MLRGIEGDKGLVAKSKAAHHAISAPFSEPISFSDKPLVVQYEVKYQKGSNCGGGYLKLLEDGFQTAGKEFSDKTPWTIMFGPDLTCPGTKVRFEALSGVGRALLTALHRFTSSSVTRAQSLASSRRSTLRCRPSPRSIRTPTSSPLSSSKHTRFGGILSGG